ncbi:MAG: type II toxin-antitoxin system prevent-host-death family antitoxin [Gammaproteobacteria bacterium]|nr:type II toxin-antitoxin system prevent-host-death family antitoxin [Gammaproteobacteria bacterium]
MRIEILEAKNRLSELIRAARGGDEVIIANRGKPVARLVALHESEDSAPRGSGSAILDWLDQNPTPVAMRRSVKQIDSSIEEERESWS